MRTTGYFKFIIIGFLLFVQLTSCKKDKITDNPNSTFSITNPDTTLVGKYYNSPIEFRFDADNDNVNDFKLTSVIVHGLHTYAEATITCLQPDAYVYTKTVIDTTFINKHIDTIQHPTYKTEVIVRTIYGPQRMSDKDSIGSINEIHAVAVVKQTDTIASSDSNWLSSAFTLSREDHSVLYIEYVIGTTWYLNEDRTYKFDNSLFPNDQIVYIKIRKDVKGTVKQGWIKLLVADKYKISLLEVGMEK